MYAAANPDTKAISCISAKRVKGKVIVKDSGREGNVLRIDQAPAKCVRLRPLIIIMKGTVPP